MSKWEATYKVTYGNTWINKIERTKYNRVYVGPINWNKEDTKMDKEVRTFKVGDKVRAKVNNNTDFSGGEGIVEKVIGDDFSIRVTKASKCYKIGQLSGVTNWYLDVNLIEYNAEMQQALEESIDKYQKIVDWLEESTYTYLQGEDFKRDLVKQVFDNDEKPCPLCQLVKGAINGNCKNCILKENYGKCDVNGWLPISDAKSGLEYLAAEQDILQKLKTCRVEKPVGVVKDAEGNPLEVGKAYVCRQKWCEWSRILVVSKIENGRCYWEKSVVVFDKGKVIKKLNNSSNFGPHYFDQIERVD